MISPNKLRPPVKWHGGKYYLSNRIIEKFPKHHTYVEPFGGAASVLLNKHESPVEVYNDLDCRITRLYRVLRDHPEELQRVLQLTPYSEVEFNQVLNAKDEENEIELARRDFVRWRQSLGGRGDAFSFTKHRVRRGMADVVSGYLSTIDEQLPLIAERFRTVQIVERPAVDVIKKWDSPETLFYCDPPYVLSTRDINTRDVYGYEMSEEEHTELADTLNACEGMVILSGYPSDLYNRLFAKWEQVTFDMPNHSAGGKTKQRKEEVLWIKPESRRRTKKPTNKGRTSERPDKETS